MQIKQSGFAFMRCRDYIQRKGANGKIAVLRVDVDSYPHNLSRLGNVLYSLKIRATFFVRLHGPYNLLSQNTFNLIQELIQQGHEIGLHSEILDFCEVTGEDPLSRMRRDIELLKLHFSLDALGVSSHGDFSGVNNLDFWKKHSPDDVGALYEAYDESHLNLFRKSTYVSDSEWLNWKKYESGVLKAERFQSISNCISHDTQLLYILLHPETFFSNHPFEHK